MNNLVDLTGMVFQAFENVTEERAILFFILNVQEKYIDSNGERVVNYQKIPCSISKRLDGDRSSKYDFLKRNLVEGSLIRVQGKLNGYYEEFDNNNEAEESKPLLLNRVWVRNYQFLNKYGMNTPNNEEDEADQINNSYEEDVQNLYNFTRPIKFGES